MCDVELWTDLWVALNLRSSSKKIVGLDASNAQELENPLAWSDSRKARCFG